MRLRLLCGLMLLMFACSKVNQLKQPTSLCFEVVLSDSDALNQRIQYNSSTITLEQMTLEGQRTEGSDVYFTMDYQPVESIAMSSGVMQALNFDIPQGMYTHLNLRWHPQHGSIFQVEGNYRNDNGMTYPMRIELTMYVPFSIVYEGNSADFQVDKTTGTIVLAIRDWFLPTQLDLLNNAELVEENGQAIVLINAEHNVKLYQHIFTAFAKTPQHTWRINR